MTTLSVVIPFYNRPHFLRRTLWSIYYMTAHAESFEIIIVDDKSQDALRAAPIVEEFQDKLNIKLFYRENKTGMNGGICRNIGAKLAEGELLLFQDPECIHVTSIINQMIGKFVYGWDLAMFPACYSLGEESQKILESFDLSNQEAIVQLRKSIELQPREIRGDGDDGWFLHSHFAPVTRSAIYCMRRNTFLEMGGFDEDFFRYWGNEDTDFINRMRLKELPVLYQDDMLSFHQHHYDPRDLEDVQNRQNGWNYNQQLWLNEKKDRKDWVANRNCEWGIL